MRIKPLHLVIVALLAHQIFMIAFVNAQSEEISNTPHLNGHYFVSSMNMPSAFIQSHFGMNLGIASSTGFESTILVIDDQQIIGLKGSLIFADLNFNNRQKIKDWVAFNARVGLTARIGTEVQSLLSQGVNTASSMRLGWSFKLIERPKYLLSSTITVNNYGVNLISIKGFIKDVIQDSTVTSISKSVPILNGGVGLQFAYSISKLFGFQAHGSVLYGDSFERGSSDLIYSIGGVVDCNLANSTKIPLGFALGFAASSLPDIVQVKNKSATEFSFKMSYMGSEHYDFGLELSNSSIPLPDVQDKVRSTGFFVTSKYYFN